MSKPIRAISGDHTRHERSYAAAAGLSPVSGKTVVAKFDGGLLLVRWRRSDVARGRAAPSRRRSARRLHRRIRARPSRSPIRLADILRFRLANDRAPATKTATTPVRCAAIRCSRWRSICRRPSANFVRSRPSRGWRICLTSAPCCAWAAPWSIFIAKSFHKVPKRITLDIDDTFDAVHGGQQLRLFNAHYDEYGFQPIVVFDGEGRFITAVLRPAKRPGGKEIKAFLRRLLRAIRANWPKHRDPAARRQPLLLSRGSRLVSVQWPRLHPRRRADFDLAPAYPGPRGQREGALRGRAQARQGPSLQGVSRRRRELEPR